MTDSEKDLQVSLGRLERVKKKFTLNITLLGTLFLVIYLCLYIYFKAYFAAVATFICLVFFIPLILYCISKNLIYASRLLTMFAAVLAVALATLGLHSEVNSEYYYLPTMMLSLLLFEPQQKNAIAFSLFLPVFTWGITPLVSPFLDNVAWLAPLDFPYKYFSGLNFLGAFILTYMFLKFYSFSIQESKEIEIENEHRFMQSSKMVSLGQLASGIAHEINNPLSIIIGRTQLLKSKIERNTGAFDVPHCLQNLEKIEGTATLIARIVKGLNAFSRDNDRDPFLNQSVTQIAESAIDLCHQRLKETGIKVEIKTKIDLMVLCRDVQITQVLVNLITNSIDAIEYLDERWINIEFMADKKWISISVTDSGLGLAATERDKIMLPFYSTKVTGKGIGLGLSISKSIAESHNGLLFCDETSTHTKFTLQLPET
jgi:signal transduction histidine kinase